MFFRTAFEVIFSNRNLTKVFHVTDLIWVLEGFRAV